MSSIASFHVMESNKFDEYCKLANLHLIADFDDTKSGAVVDETVRSETRSGSEPVTSTVRSTADFKAQQANFAKLYQFLQENSKQPFQFDWSGYALADLLGYLKQEKQIDLFAKTFEGSDGEIQYHLLDQEVKKRYIDMLDPAKFSDKTLASEYDEANARAQESLMERLRAEFGAAKAEQMSATFPAMEQEQFPERGAAFMDGITIIHECLKLVDETAVVAMHTGKVGDL